MKKLTIEYILYIYNIINDDGIYIIKDKSIKFIKILSFFRGVYIFFGAILLLPLFIISMKCENYLKTTYLKYIKI